MSFMTSLHNLRRPQPCSPASSPFFPFPFNHDDDSHKHISHLYKPNLSQTGPSYHEASAWNLHSKQILQIQLVALIAILFDDAANHYDDNIPPSPQL